VSALPPISEAPLRYNPAWTYTFHIVLGHPSKPQVLLLPGEAGWHLPSIVSREHDLRAVGHLQRAVRRQLSVEALVLRCLHIDRTRAADKQVAAIFAVEAPSSAWSPPDGAIWIGPTEIANLSLAHPTHRPLIESWLSREGDRASVEAIHPWVLPGWYATAVAWAEARLRELGYGSVSSIQQVRNWDLSCVLRFQTPEGATYLKALPPEYASEVALTRLLGARHPDHIPPVLATDEQRRWLLLGEAGPPMDDNNITHWEAAVTLLARLQIASADDLEPLLATGCLDQRPRELAAQVDLLVGDADVCAALDADEYAQLRALAPTLKVRCEQLAAFGLPSALVHGDLHTGNISLLQGRLVFVDWGDGCVAHPFFALFALLDEHYFPKHVPDADARLRALYLSQWTAFAPLKDLQAVLALAESLAILRYTLGCQRCFASLDATWRAELLPTLRSCLRTLLRNA
jgi:Ser/Thr protein kinase RdoA (MazF antagonist)